MAIRMIFKRGPTESIENYQDIKVGEPVYDYDTGLLYIKRSDNELYPISGSCPVVDNLPTFDDDKHTNTIVYELSSGTLYVGLESDWQALTISE